MVAMVTKNNLHLQELSTPHFTMTLVIFFTSKYDRSKNRFLYDFQIMRKLKVAEGDGISIGQKRNKIKLFHRFHETVEHLSQTFKRTTGHKPTAHIK